MFTVGSLFAGVGGFDLGMEQAGFKVLWQAEWDKQCQSVLRRHWPDCVLYGDVTDVNGAEIAPVDVITFGSPCQDLSVAGKRAGLDGGRSSMFFQATRIIKEMRNATAGTFPRIAVWENVPGALSSNKGADFGVVLDTLADVGALVIEWAVLDARWFGVAQRRRRVFVVAIFDPAIAERCLDPLLPVGEGRRRDSAPRKPTRQNVAGTLGGGSGNRGWSPDTDRMTFIPVKRDRISVAAGDDGTDTPRTAVTSKWHKGSGGPAGDEAYNLVVEVPASLPGQQELFSEPFVKSRRAQSDTDHETWVEGEVAPTLNAFDNGTETRATVVVLDGTRVNDIRVWDDGLVPTLKERMGTGGNNVPLIGEPTIFQPGAMSRLGGYVWPGGPSPTLLAAGDTSDNFPHVAQPIYSFDTQFGSNANVFTDLSPTLKASQQSPSVTEQYAVRRLTPLECERLMGWPNDHTRYTDTGKEQADSHRYRQCGNGVASPVAAWIGTHLVRLLEGS